MKKLPKNTIVVENPEDIQRLKKQERKKIAWFIVQTLAISISIFLFISQFLPVAIRTIITQYGNPAKYCKITHDQKICTCKEYKIIKDRQGNILEKKCLAWIPKTPKLKEIPEGNK